MYFLLLFSALSFPSQHLHCRHENIIIFPSFYFMFLAAPFSWFGWVTRRHLAGKKNPASALLKGSSLDVLMDLGKRGLVKQKIKVVFH